MRDIINIAAHSVEENSRAIRAIAENVANAHTSPASVGDNPYKRKEVTFRTHYNRAANAHLPSTIIKQSSVNTFKQKYQPSHPASDERGMVLMPNINLLQELSDMRILRHHLKANLRIWEGATSMHKELISLIKR